MTKIAVEYEILRNVKASGLVTAATLTRKPMVVATIIDEEAFLKCGEMIHNETVFFEDRYHDWNCSSAGELRYYSRVAEFADVLVVYKTTTQR